MVPGGRDGPVYRRRILRFVRAFTAREGYLPTLREIGEAAGLARDAEIALGS